jgi:hypothetical protein
MRFISVALALLSVQPAPARAEIAAQTDSGFVVRHVVETNASPDDAWKALVAPAGWWNGDHTFSGDANNLSIDARAGGCFCEVLPGEGEKGWLDPRGGVEHMRVVFVDRAKALRMVGALGPLQSEALLGTLTVTIKPIDGGAQLTWSYVVAGYMRYKREQIVPAVDKMIGEQATRLAEKLGPRAAEPAAPDALPPTPQPKPGMESGR